jgi:WD40 repeat protein
METPEQSTARPTAKVATVAKVGTIARIGTSALAMRSSALVARGLRDLARDSNWLIKKIFSGHSQQLAISSAGQVCAISTHIHHGTPQVALYDLELSVPTMALTVHDAPQGNSKQGRADSPAAFAWSPDARYLAGAWSGWPAGLHLFDLHGKLYLGKFGSENAAAPQASANLAWSDSGDFFVVTSRGKNASLRVWEPKGGPLAGDAAREILEADWIEPQQAGEEFAEEGAFGGYGRAAFSPNEEALASVIEFRGEWADDSIVVADVATLSRRKVFGAQGHVTDLTWTPDSEQIIYCSAGQAYRLEPGSVNAEPLTFGAELCVCHPHLPLCVCFSSWLKNSAKGRLFLTDLNRATIFDEYPAEGVVDLRWSADGSKAYAVTRDGMAYIYEPPLI